MSTPDDDIEFLSGKQAAALRALRTFSALLSVLGSCLIISHVIIYKRRNIDWNPKHRLLVGLSVADLIFSAENLIFAPFVYPITSPSPVCSFDAFVHLLGNAAAYYNAALSCYFLCVIRYSIKDEQFAARYEPFCHLLPVSVALTAATTGLFLGIYNPKADRMGCWVEDYPLGCSAALEDIDSNHSDSDATTASMIECRGDSNLLKLFPAIAMVIPFTTAALTMIVCNILIYRFVRNLERRNAIYSVRYSITAATAATAGALASNPAESERRQSTRRRSSFLAAFAREQTSQRRRTETMKRSKKIASQSFCYIGAYFACYLPGLILWIVGFFYPAGLTNGTLMFVQVLNALLFPAQGFLNMSVYLRPQYLVWRTAPPNGNSILYSWCMTVTLQSPAPPKPRQQHHPSPPELQHNSHYDTTTANNSKTNGGEGGEKAELEGLDDALSGAFLSEAFTCTTGAPYHYNAASQALRCSDDQVTSGGIPKTSPRDKAKELHVHNDEAKEFHANDDDADADADADGSDSSVNVF